MSIIAAESDSGIACVQATSQENIMQVFMQEKGGRYTGIVLLFPFFIYYLMLLPAGASAESRLSPPSHSAVRIIP